MRHRKRFHLEGSTGQHPRSCHLSSRVNDETNGRRRRRRRRGERHQEEKERVRLTWDEVRWRRVRDEESSEHLKKMNRDETKRRWKRVSKTYILLPTKKTRGRVWCMARRFYESCFSYVQCTSRFSLWLSFYFAQGKEEERKYTQRIQVCVYVITTTQALYSSRFYVALWHWRFQVILSSFILVYGLNTEKKINEKQDFIEMFVGLFDDSSWIKL